MAFFVIASNQNKTVKYISALRSKKKRDGEKKFVIEGEKFIKEIPLNWGIDCYMLSESFARENEDNLFEYERRADVVYVADSIFKSISDTVNPQGILAVCMQMEYNIAELLQKDNPFFIILEEINDPGNLGTIIRTADAAGADGIIMSKGCAEIYNPKVLRSTAGSIFNIPIVCGVCLDDVLAKLHERKIKTFAAHLKGQVYPYSVDLKHGIGLIIGNEANGISDGITQKAGMLVKLPMLGKAESLNASVAAGILIYEAVRQRGEI